MDNENQIQKTEQGVISPLAAAAELVSNNRNMHGEKLAKLLEMQERWDDTQAKKAFVVAMAAFKENPPKIIKDAAVSFKQTSYKHATLGNVTATINAALSAHGLTASWITSQDSGSIMVTCKITHVLGYSEETCLSAAPDTSGSKNPIQAIGSTVTYLQRYTLLALTGLATYEDDDGAGAGDNKDPKPPELTETNKRVLSAICVKAQTYLPAGEHIDTDKIASLFFVKRNGVYPGDMSRVDKAVE